MDLNTLKNVLTTNLYGMTKAEAIHQSVCIDCKADITSSSFPTESDEREYYISGLCPECYNRTIRE